METLFVIINGALYEFAILDETDEEIKFLSEDGKESTVSKIDGSWNDLEKFSTELQALIRLVEIALELIDNADMEIAQLLDDIQHYNTLRNDMNKYILETQAKIRELENG